MMSHHTITLFTAPPPSGTGLSAFMVSMLVHGAAFGVVSLALQNSTHVVEDHKISERYTVRLLEVHNVQSQRRPSAGRGISYPGPHAVTGGTQPGGRPAARSSVPPRLARLASAHQTLVQPDIRPDVVLPRDTPIPAALLWSPVNSKIKKINPPPQHEVTTGDVAPSLDLPNHELNLADLKISSTSFSTVTPAPPPSTTSPLVVQGEESVHRVPETASGASGPPTPARVLSISDLQVQDGIIALPPANQTAPASSWAGLITGHDESSEEAGSGDTAGNETGAGTGNRGDKDKQATPSGSAAKNDVNTGANQASALNSGAGSGKGSMVDRINLPQNGRFGVVVVGASVAEAYPETLGLWGDRLAYTVYVHAGLARNWILQYSVPLSADAAAAGDVVRPDAPWPFYIVVPHIAPGLNADAIMVHGFVNAAGRFEQLAVVFPAEFTQQQFVLNALQEWKFRPAMQNGQVTLVEVLLIIPEAPD